MAGRSQRTTRATQEGCQQSLTASSIASQRTSRGQLSTQGTPDPAQPNDDDADATVTTIMDLPETVTAPEQQEAAPQTTEDPIVEVEETPPTTLLDAEARRARNLARRDELRQRLINQQLEQEIEDLERQVKERAQKQGHKARHNKPSLSHDMQGTPPEPSDNDNPSDDDSFPNPMAGQRHGRTESGDMMLANDRPTKRREH